VNQTYDLIIIGAGPSGLSCAIEAQQAGMKYLLVDKGSIVHAIQDFQRDMFFFSTPELLEIGNVPFVISTTRPTSLDCVNYYRRVAEFYHLNCMFYTKIVSSERSKEGFLLKTANGEILKTRYCVIATGYYDTPNPLNVPGEQLPHVSHFYRDPLPYYQQDVVIVGGKNSAVEAALDLYRHGARVTVIHRGETMNPNVKYWIMPDFQNRVAAGSIILHLSAIVKEFRNGVTFIQQAGRVHEIKTDFAFVLIGYRTDVTFLQSFGITIDPDSLTPAMNPETMETNVLGLFVAGGLVGGRFNNKVFIENGREHGKKIISALTR
jgi:thioredoxin reductase (NADPH)